MCNHSILPQHAARSHGAWSGKWSQGPPAVNGSGAEQAASGDGGGSGGASRSGNSGVGHTKPTKLEALANSKELLATAGLDDEVLQLLESRLETTKSEVASSKPAWVMLQRKEKELAKVRKQVSARKDGIADLAKQLDELRAKLAEGKDELATLETKEAEMAAAVSTLKHKMEEDGAEAAVDPPSVQTVVASVSQSLGLPDEVVKSENGARLLETMARLASTLAELKAEHTHRKEAEEAEASTGSKHDSAPDGSTPTQASPVPGEGGDAGGGSDDIGMHDDDPVLDKHESDEFLAALPEEQKKFGARLVAMAKQQAKRAKVEPSSQQQCP